ncbi:MAG: hypothetical protein IPG98_13895 [Burkholderiales bacterium]|nr:hypothetical protein [Burkholderiales bacterium]MBK8667303.1 hypothetical protein [Burkholderiales bacterium]
MQISTLFRPPRTACLAGAALAAALLTGCALPPAGTPPAAAAAVTGSATAPLITAPPTSVGTWYDLGHVMAPWLGGDAPVPVSGPNAPTRVAGLRREDGHWLAIVVAQVAPAGSAPCPAPTSLHVVGGSADGAGCLRLRRDADFDRWLQQQHSVLYQWLDQRDLTSRPRAWISDRVPGGAGGAIETHALVDPSLIEPTTRTNIDFLEGGQPGLQWARQFAAATRGAHGALQVPPFPFAPQLAPPAPPPPVVVAPPPTRATQVLPERPQPPRRDRE